MKKLMRTLRSLVFVLLVALVGRAGAQSAVHVLGGAPTPIQVAPWTAFVAYDFGPEKYVCTGSVIDSLHVLTAGHCLYDPAGNLAPPSSLSVEAGVSNFLSPAPSDTEQLRSVASFRIHPKYVHPSDGSVASDDVAVLALTTPLNLSGAAVQAIQLPAPNPSFPRDATVTIAGFGLEDGTAHYASGTLESMTATVDDQGKCGDDTKDALVLINNAVILCTESPTSALCPGDSGSGVVTAGPTPTLLGVANGSRCTIGGHTLSTYVGAPEILQFIKGDNKPPEAPRPSLQSIPFRLIWSDPLVPGARLTCSSGGWSASSVGVNYSFVNTTNGQVLQTGATPIYLVPPAAVGTTIECVTALTNSGGTTVVNSGPTPTVASAPSLRIERAGPLSGRRGHTIRLHVVLIGQSSEAGTLRVCIARPRSVAQRVCRSTHRPLDTSGTLALTLNLRIKLSAPLGTARIAINATNGASTARRFMTIRVGAR
jgi:hypothetical protein